MTDENKNNEDESLDQDLDQDETKENKVEEDDQEDSDSEKEIDEEKEDEKESKTDKKEDKKSGKKAKTPLKERIRAFFKNPKKRLIFIISAIVLLLAIFALGFFLLLNDKKDNPTPAEEQAAAVVPEAPKFEAVLDGVMTDQASATKHPLAVMVENHPDARPQAGLEQASIVYEAIAEGGITRFLALFGTKEAEKVGPVRSARTYYVDWAHGYNAYLAHVGGNIDALDKIAKEKTLDLDQFRYSAPYWREKSGNVASEHTMFTSTTKLRTQAATNKYETANTFSLYRFKDDPTEEVKATLPEAQNVTVDFSSSEYKVKFAYDRTTNSYKRFLAGTPHLDRVTKNQLNPKDIVVMTVKRTSTVTRINEAGYNMTTVGTGPAKIFHDGQTITGTWKKEKAESREIFYDDKGQEIIFNRGQLWICAIPPEATVSVN